MNLQNKEIKTALETFMTNFALISSDIDYDFIYDVVAGNLGNDLDKLCFPQFVPNNFPNVFSSNNEITSFRNRRKHFDIILVTYFELSLEERVVLNRLVCESQTDGFVLPVKKVIFIFETGEIYDFVLDIHGIDNIKEILDEVYEGLNLITVDSRMFTMLVHLFNEGNDILNEIDFSFILYRYWIKYITSFVPNCFSRNNLIARSENIVTDDPTLVFGNYFSVMKFNDEDIEFVIKRTPQYKVFVRLRSTIGNAYLDYFYNLSSIIDGDFSWIRDLSCDGDVELNPGPAVYSTMRANQYKARTAELQLFGVSESLNKLADSLGNAKVTVNVECPEFKDKMERLCPELLLLFTNIYRCRKDKVTCFTILAQFLVGFNISTEIIYKFYDGLHNQFIKFIKWVKILISEKPVNQSNEDKDDSVVKGFLSSIFSIFCPNGGSKEFYKYCNNIYTVHKGSVGIESLIVKLIAYSKQILNLISMFFYGAATDEFTNDLLVWNDRSVKLLNIENRSQLSNVEIVSELDDLVELGNKYCQILSGCKNKSLVDTFNLQYRQLLAMQIRFSKTAISQRMKIPPYVISLYGGSGVGKSQITPYVFLTLMSQDPYYVANPERLKDFASKIHYRQTENEFWDSLQNSQDYLCIDDFGQTADRMNNTEYAEMIRITNSAPAFAHMSNIFEKGNINLDFKAILLTTNIKFPKTENINHPDALARRLEGYTWEVTVKKDYLRSTGKAGSKVYRLDVDKVGEHINFDIYEFVKYNVLNGKIEGTLGWKEFQDYIVEDYRKHRYAGEMHHNDLNSFITTLIGDMRPQNQGIFDWVLGTTYSSDIQDIYNVYDENRDKIDKYIHGNETTSVFSNAYQTFIGCKTSESQMKIIKDNYSSFVYILTKVFPDSIYDGIFKRVVTNELKPSMNSNIQDSLTRIFKMIKIMGEAISAYLIVVGGAGILGTMIYKFVSCVSKWWFSIEPNDLVFPKCVFDYLEINGEICFRAIDLDFIRKDFPNAMNWNLASNYLLMKSDYSWKFRKNVSKNDDIYKYVMFVLDFIETQNLNIVNETKYDTITGPKFKVLLETNVDLKKIQVEVRGKEKQSDLEPVDNKVSLEKYSVNIKNSKYPILERYDISTGVKTGKAIVEVTIDQNVNSVMNKAITNQVVISTSYNGKMSNKGFGVFVKGKFMATFLHLLPAVYDRIFYMKPVTWTASDVFVIEPKDVIVHIPKHLDCEGIKFPLCDLKKYEYIFSEGFGSKDCVILEFSNNHALPNYQDITKHFISKEDLSKVGGSKGILVTFDEKFNRNINRFKLNCLDYPFDQVCGDINYGNITGGTYARDGYCYDAITQGGDCGSLLFVENQFISGKIIGFHVSGFQNGIGNSVSVTKNMLTCISDLNLQISLDLQLQNDKIEYLPKGVLYVGDVSDPVIQAGSSQIRPSCVYGLRDKPKVKPAFLYPRVIDGEMLDPFKIGLKKYYTVSPYISNDIIDSVYIDFDWFLRKYSSNINRSVMRVLSLEESVFGIDNEKYWRSIPMGTSPGYSWPKNSFKGKKYYFQDGKISDEVIERVNARIELAKKGIRQQHLYVCTLKDEVRPIAKVMAGKTRVFTVPQLDYVLAVRMYFGGFVVNFMNNKIMNRSLVGINMYSTESHSFAKLLKKHPCILTGDFSNWDGSIRADISNKILKFINSEYSRFGGKDVEMDNYVRKVLFMDLINSIVLIGPKAYLLTHSLPSGHPLTTIVNTMYNIFRSFLEYHLIILSKSKIKCIGEKWDEFVSFMNDYPISDHTLKLDIKQYIENTEGGFYGDDLVLSVSKEFSTFYNYQTLKEVNNFMGHSYTTSEKMDVIDRNYDDFSKANILKRYFVWNEHHFRYIAPLDLNTVFEIPNWVKQGHDIEEQTIINLEVAARELTLHDRKIYDDFISDYKIICEKEGLCPYFQDYNVLQHRVLTGEYMHYLF